MDFKMISTQLILQMQEKRTKIDEELALGTFPKNLRKILNFKQIEECKSILCGSKGHGDSSYIIAHIFIARH